MAQQRNHVVIVTGASGGIGAATACLAARRGYAVCVNYRQYRAAAQRVVADIETQGGMAISIAADISDESDVVRLFEECDRRLGAVCAWMQWRQVAYIVSSQRT